MTDVRHPTIGWLLCTLRRGHDWEIDPPWSGDELDSEPQCERCGYVVERVGVAGIAGGERRA